MNPLSRNPGSAPGLICGLQCSVSLPHGALGWSVTVGFPGHIHLFFNCISYVTFILIGFSRKNIYVIFLAQMF